MFSIELKVNGALCGHIYGRNVGIKDNLTEYIWEYYRPETRELAKGTVHYNRDKGIEGLTLAILKKVVAQHDKEG